MIWLLLAALVVIAAGLAFAGAVIVSQRVSRRAAGPVEQLLGPVIALSADAAVVADASGRIELVNRRAEQLFGYAPGRMVGLELEALIPTRFHGRHRQFFAAWHEAPRERQFDAAHGLFARRGDGTEFPVEIGLAPVALGRVLAVIREARTG